MWAHFLLIRFLLRILVTLREKSLKQLFLKDNDGVLCMVICQVVSSKLREHRAYVEVGVSLARSRSYQVAAVLLQLGDLLL